MSLVPASERGIQTAIMLNTNQEATETLAEDIVAQMTADAAKHVVKKLGFALGSDGYLDGNLAYQLIIGSEEVTVSTIFGETKLLDIFEGNVDSLRQFLYLGIEQTVMTRSPDEEILGRNYSALKQIGLYLGFTVASSHERHIRTVLNTDLDMRYFFSKDPKVSMSDRTIKWLHKLMNTAGENAVIRKALERNSDLEYAAALLPNVPQGVQADIYSTEDRLTRTEREQVELVLAQNPQLLFGTLLLMLSPNSLGNLEREVRQNWAGATVLTQLHQMDDSNNTYNSG